MSDTITIGAARFLNAWPLVCGLDEARGVSLSLDAPSALGPLLKDGRVDVALLPSIEYFRSAGDVGERARGCGAVRPGPTRLVVLPVAVVASRGEVGSVRLFAYRDVQEVRRVLLDRASRSANAMARILLVRRFGLRPHFVTAAPGPAGRGEAGGPGAARAERPPDAELVIGDRGLVAERPQAASVIDLGREWEEFVHRPFVYAFWVARADAPLRRIERMLIEARDRGLAARDRMAERAHEERGIPVEVARRYLFHEIRYEFGPNERAGLRVFQRLAAAEGLAPAHARLRFPSAEAGVSE